MIRKGLSQVLTLIVAAAVLMMVALTLIFMTQGGLSDLGQGATTSSCTSTIDTKCTGNSGTVNTPVVCTDSTGAVKPKIKSQYPEIGPEEVSCSQWNG